MTDRAFEPAEANPFEQFGPKAISGVAEGLPKPQPDEDDADNPFAKFGPKALPEPSSATGAFARGAARSVLPAVGALPAMAAGAELGGAAGLAVGGPIGGAIGGLVGGGAGFFGGARAIDAAQNWGLSHLSEAWRDALGMSDRQEKIDQSEHPIASFLGGLAPYALTMSPGTFAGKALPENATALQRIMSHPATARVFGGAAMGGMELGQEAIGEQPTDWRKVAISTGFGIVFNKPNRFGEAISEIGARPARRALGLPEPAQAAPEAAAPQVAPVAPIEAAEAVPAAPPSSGIAPSLFHAPAGPTVIQAADAGVIGAGRTEATFMGGHETPPEAAANAHEAARQEQSLIGPEPARSDVHSVARQMDFDLFGQYEALRARRAALQGEPAAAAQLAATETELSAIEPQVQAAYRRAAEVTGTPIHEPPPEVPAVPAPAEAVRSIEDQRDHIVNEVKQSLIDAGRPSEEAQAAAQLVAARYEARAARFKGALGTPQELFDRESSDIRKMERVAKKTSAFKNPNSARALDDFQERMAQAKELRRKARESAGGSARIMSAEERFAGVTEDEWKAQLEDSIEALEPEERQSVRDDLSHLPAEDLQYLAERAEAGLPLFQQESAPTFYSAVERAVTSSKQEKAPASQWLGTIKNMPGVKPEELEWLGLEDWLKEQKGAVTKQEIADYVRANRIEVKEVTKGEADARHGVAEQASEDARQGWLRSLEANGETPETAAAYQRYLDAEQIAVRAVDEIAAGGGTKFSQYTIPGGKNYREMLLTLPNKESEEIARRNAAGIFVTGEKDSPTLYRSSHFDEPNILAHVRFNDRTIDGKKTLFVEEVQSDWHQTGKKYGYKDGQPLTTRKQENSLHGDVFEAVDSRGTVVGRGFSPDEALQAAKGMPSVPDAPFKTTWPELAMKRMIRYAAENGYDQIAWTTGETQAARYDLSQQVREINAIRRDGKFQIDGVTPDGQSILLGNQVAPAALADVVGKDLAEKIAAQTEDRASYSGLDLKVGGEGMKGFYDQILPVTVNKLVKKFGGKVGRADIEAQPVHTLPITDKLHEAAVEQGFPLFQKALGSFLPDVANCPGLKERPILKLANPANASTFIHESGHEWLEQLMRDDAHPLAPADLKADAKTVRDWLGIENHQDLNTGWPGERGTKARAAHEKFARGFEQYLRLGIAPSPQLASVFAKFKAWLTRIYQTIRGLGEPISEDIRGVFDRMLVSEPRRTVIAPDRPAPRTLAELHEADAEFYANHEADAARDRVAAESGRLYVEDQHAPTLETRDDAAASEPPGEARSGGGEGGEIHPPGRSPGPEPGRSGAGADHEAQRDRRTETEPESPGLRETARRSGGREEPRAVPLAGSPAANFTVAGESFNVGRDGNVRAENITSAPQFIAAINESAERIPGGGPLTMGEMQAIADDFALDPRTLDEGRLAATFGGIQNLSSKIFALRQAVKTQSETVFNAMRNVRETGSDAATAQFAMEASRLDMMMSVLSSVTTETGRALGMSFKNLEGWSKAQDLNEFLKANTGRTLFQLQTIAKLGAQLDTPAKVAKYLRDAGKRSFGGMVLEYWINGLISGIATHATYTVGNTILTAEKLGPETAAAAMIGAARKAMGREGQTVRLGEVGAQFGGALRNTPAAMQAAIEGFRTGMTTLLPGETARPMMPFAGDTSLVTARTIGNEPVTWTNVGADLFGLVRGLRDGIVSGAELIKAGGEPGAPVVGLAYSPLGQIPDIAYRGVPVVPLGTAVRLPGRFIAAIHSFFRTTNYSAYKAGGAYRAASNEGLTGNAFDARVAQIRQNPDEAMMEAWRTEATETALMGHVGKFGETLSKLTNTEFNLPVLGGVRMLKFVDPFVHISSNVLKQSLIQRTPFGILSSELRADLAGKNGNIAQDTATARMLVGTALSVTFGGLAAEGYASGSGPSDPKQAAMWRLAGNQAHSVRVGDIWYQVNRLGPMGMLAGVAADLYDVAHEAEKGDVLTAAAHLQHAFTQNVLDESFMRGPADLIKAVEDPGRYGEAYIRNLLSSFVPYSVGMAQIARAADPYSRQARTTMDAIRAKIPGHLDSYFKDPLYARRDVWGEELPNPDAFGMRGLTAIWEQRVGTDPVNLAMVQLGIAPAQVERKIRNVELTDQQYDDFARIAGRMTKMRLDTIVRSPDWQTWPGHIKHDVISEVIRQSREASRGVVMMKYPQIVKDAVEAKRQKMTGEPRGIE